MSTTGFRVGLGYDSHRLAAGGPLRLGGVSIPCDVHAIGHSDADALLHAITDALLGAASMGDIGELFPDTDSANRGRDSGQMLTTVCQRLQAKSIRVVNVDCTVLLERPKLSHYKDAMRMRIAELLEIPAHDIGLKAKTGEGVDSIGRQEAIAVHCVALIEQKLADELE